MLRPVCLAEGALPAIHKRDPRCWGWPNLDLASIPTRPGDAHCGEEPSGRELTWRRLLTW
jgi:hypothetical protein